MPFPRRTRAAWALGGLAAGAAVGFWTGQIFILQKRPTGFLHLRQVEENAAGPQPGAVVPASGNRLPGSALSAAGPIPYAASPEGTLRNILAVGDTLHRMALLKQWFAEISPDARLVALQEFSRMAQAQERVGGMEAMGLMLQSMEVIADSLAAAGAGESIDHLATALKDQSGDDVLMAVRNHTFTL